jgi:integrase
MYGTVRRRGVLCSAAGDRSAGERGGGVPDIVDQLLATGCRIGEVVAIRWSDIEFAATRDGLHHRGPIKTETGKDTPRATPRTDRKGTYRRPKPRTDRERQLPEAQAED